MVNIGFEIVKPTEADASLILQWRNDPQTLAVSFHGEPKVMDRFIHEFRRDYFCFADLPPLFAVVEGVRSAFIRLRPVLDPTHKTDKCCEVSINLAPDQRGKGLGTLILRELLEFIKGQGYDTVLAEIKVTHAQSIQAFQNAGFVKLDQIVKSIEDTEDKVAILRMLANLQEKSPLHQQTFIIAEVGSNWRVGDDEESYKTAFKMIDIVKSSGADAVKFQVFRPETTYVENAGFSDYLAESGYHESIQDIYSKNAMPYEMIKELSDHCKTQNIEFMASAFSIEDIEMVNPYVKRHKIASYEIGHIHLLTEAAKSGKPLILSTGAATEFEIEWAVNTFYENGGKDLTLLQCTACYPAPSDAINLRAIPWLKSRFGTRVGLSDHTRHPYVAPLAAVALGAQIIEKHFTLNRTFSGPDHAFAIEPDELRLLAENIREVERMLGTTVKQIDESEEELRQFARRGVQAIKEIRKGEVFTEGGNFAILRPGKQQLGVHSRYLSEIEGKIAKNDIPKGKGIQITDWK